MRFEYWKSGDGRWTWELKTSVDDVVAHGGHHLSRENCLAAIKLVKLAASAPAVDLTSLHASAPRQDAFGALQVQPV